MGEKVLLCLTWLCIGGAILFSVLPFVKPEVNGPILMIATPVSEPLTYQRSSNRGTGNPVCVRRFFIESIGGEFVREERNLTFAPEDSPCLATGKLEIPTGKRHMSGYGSEYFFFAVLCLLGSFFFLRIGIGEDEWEELTGLP